MTLLPTKLPSVAHNPVKLPYSELLSGVLKRSTVRLNVDTTQTLSVKHEATAS